MGAGAPKITVCVCTHNRAAYLRDCLDGLRGQSVGPAGFDIIVVDSGSGPAEATAIAALVAEVANARLIRVDQPGLSRARNAAARAVGQGYLAYLDDDAVAEPDWIADIRAILNEANPPPALLGGMIRPLWEAPLPSWWPAELRGVLSVIEVDGAGDYRRPGVAAAMEPYGANMVVHVPDLLAQGGFLESVGRQGRALLSDEEKVLAWGMQDRGLRVMYDSRLVVHHQIQAERLTVPWLLSRMYWQGQSRVISGRHMAPGDAIWTEALRRLAVATLLAPLALIPSTWPWLIGPRWRLAYAHGFLRAWRRS